MWSNLHCRSTEPTHIRKALILIRTLCVCLLHYIKCVKSLQLIKAVNGSTTNCYEILSVSRLGLGAEFLGCSGNGTTENSHVNFQSSDEHCLLYNPAYEF